MRRAWFGLGLWMVGVTPAAAGTGDNLFGGRVVSDTQLTVEVGFPDVELGLRVPVSDTVDVRPRARFTWARGLDVGALETTLGIDLRLTLMDQGRFTVGLIGSLPVHLAVRDTGPVAAGVGLLWPGLMATWEVEGVVDLDLGVQLQDDLYILPEGGVTFEARVPLRAGVGYQLATGVQLGLLIEGGPRFGGLDPKDRGRVGAWARVVAGLGYTF